MLERAPFPAQALPQKARAKRVHLVDPGQQPCPGGARRSRLCEFGEYLNEQLLLRLPHKQFVFTPWSGRCTDLPKVLRVFFRHDERLHGEISRLIYRLVLDFATAAAGKPIRTAAVVVLQTAGAFSRWNPHWHSLFLEGGFDREGRFIHLSQRSIWRR